MHLDPVAGARVGVRHIVGQPGFAWLLFAVYDVAQMVVEQTMEVVRLHSLDRPLHGASSPIRPFSMDGGVTTSHSHSRNVNHMRAPSQAEGFGPSGTPIRQRIGYSCPTGSGGSNLYVARRASRARC